VEHGEISFRDGPPDLETRISAWQVAGGCGTGIKGTVYKIASSAGPTHQPQLTWSWRQVSGAVENWGGARKPSFPHAHEADRRVEVVRQPTMLTTKARLRLIGTAFPIGQGQASGRPSRPVSATACATHWPYSPDGSGAYRMLASAIKGDSIENSQENRAGQVSMFIILSAAAASALPGG
jgi:hypothetical protein